MKKNDRMILAACFLVIASSSCNDLSINNPSPQPTATPTQAVAPQGGSSTIGNALTSFEDNSLQVKFDYPSAWSVTQTDDGWVFSLLSNSKVEVQLTLQNNANLGGLKFDSKKDLEDYLSNAYPGRPWFNTTLVNHRSGFGSEVKKSNGLDGQYYFIDSSGELIHFEFWLDEDKSQNQALRDIFSQLQVSGN